MEDIDLQQRLLSKLNQYGDSLLDEDRKTKKKAKTSTKLPEKNTLRPSKDGDHRPINSQRSLSANKSLSSTKSRKRKKTKTPGDQNEDMSRTKAATVAMDFEEELRLFKKEQLEKTRLEKEGAETEGMKGGVTAKRPPPEVIVFQDPSRRKKKRVQEEEQAEADEDKFNLKKARYEVRQFGLSGFSFEDREKCEADRAVTLGAWAPKREYINYKELISIQKGKKEQARQQREMDRKMGYSVAKKPTTEKVRVKNQGFWRDPTQDKKFFIDGQIGRYKQGVQVVSKNEITAVKSSRGKRSGRTSKIKF
ncbi:uncharacterized protein LOC117299376 [Asterias rubens]|uniref:uncharacterized protein LOC117299376 n=1 Tax=Asterias rubens TaxID=7604 RepID=UPI001455CB96|nr:uncharacterized protein LOC117299376 [Asterias rubens]